VKAGVTWLVVGAVAVVGLAATVDALRGSAEPAAPPTRSETGPAPTVSASALRGVLYYTGEDDCVLHGVMLPELHGTQVPGWQDCEFSLSPDRINIGARGTAWDRRGGLLAVGNGGVISLTSVVTADSVAVTGTAPAFTRFGNLTFARDGAVHVADPACLLNDQGGFEPCSRVAVRASDLRRVVRGHTSVLEVAEFLRGLTVEEAVWLDADRLALILAAEINLVGRFEALALVDDSSNVRLVEGGLNAGLSDLAASPRGSYLAVSTASSPGLALFDRDGNAIALPALREPHAIAWSPGETWTAVATLASIYVFRAGRPDPDVRRLPIAAADLAWR
jgi:hypothetical protein